MNDTSTLSQEIIFSTEGDYKSYILRSKMTDDRINRSAILSIEFALTIDLNFGDINIFTKQNSYIKL